MKTEDLQRVVVIGTSGSGKTTLAGRLAAALGHEHIELDAIHWMPDWEMRPLDDFREKVTAATTGDRWVIDGNYSKVRDIVWGRATTVVWLNYSRAVVLWRIVTRTLLRSLRQEVLFSGNRESLSTAMFGKESIVAWSMSTFSRRRREYPQLFKETAYAHLKVVELRRPKHAAALLGEIRIKGNMK
jgi:adenylate kinase family enzyme